MFVPRPYDGDVRAYNFRARWLKPSMERFINEDPAGDIDGPNRYAAFLNSPHNYRDPSGNFVIMTGLAILATYVIKSAAVTAVETYVESKVADLTGDTEFSFGSAFAKNFTINGVMGVIPGAAETKATTKALSLGRKLDKYAGHYAKEVAIGTAADTAWDVGVNGKDAGTAFTESLAGNLVGQAFGDSLSGVMRKGLSGIADNAPGWAKNLRLCFAAGTPVEMSEAQFGELAACVDRVREAIEDLDLGRRVLAENPVAEALAETSEPDSSWSRLVLRPLDESDDAQIELLRSPAWLSANRAKIGATIDLDLPELNLRGPAKIVSISAGPAIIPGNGRVVTGLFRHTARELLEVYVEGLPKPIVGTPRHPYWSATRQAFVPAEKLHVGEELQSSDGGTVRVTALVPRRQPATVYNIEVHGEHVYHVSPLGVLVHNASQTIDANAPAQLPTAASATRGWKVGDPINNLTAKGNVPSWTAVRSRYWENEAHFNAANYDAASLERMGRGLAPQRINPRTGLLESKELHHTPPQRDGGLSTCSNTGRMTTLHSTLLGTRGDNVMPSFQSMFTESKGKPIEYQGKTLVMMDDFPTEGATRLRLVFETCNAEWRQGVSLRVHEKGTIVMNGQKIKHAVCWHDTAPSTVEFETVGKVTAIEVKNVWDVGNGVMESWHNGAAMIVEPLPNGRRYRCNDGFADDDFDDVVFRLERAGS